MADSSGSNGMPDIIATADAQKEVIANEFFYASSPAILFGNRESSTTGLTWGYYGGRYDSTSIANGTLLLTASQTNYIVALRSTGAISTSTSITNWNNTTTYLRLYQVVTGGSTITSFLDYRQAIGLTGTGGGGSFVTQEQVEDIVGSLIVGGAGLNAAYNDGDSPPTLVLDHDGSAAWGSIIGTLSGQTDLQSALNAKQASDADLTTIAGLTATSDNFMQAKSSAWASRTVAEVSVDLQGTGLITDAVGFRTIPQNSQSTAYGLVAADSGKHILHPTADNNARTFTIPANGSVAYPVGTMITIVNQINTITIAITTDTLTWLPAGSTGSRTLAANGLANLLKVTSTAWVISGVGIT